MTTTQPPSPPSITPEELAKLKAAYENSLSGGTSRTSDEAMAWEDVVRRDSRKHMPALLFAASAYPRLVASVRTFASGLGSVVHAQVTAEQLLRALGESPQEPERE